MLETKAKTGSSSVLRNVKLNCKAPRRRDPPRQSNATEYPLTYSMSGLILLMAHLSIRLPHTAVADIGSVRCPLAHGVRRFPFTITDLGCNRSRRRVAAASSLAKPSPSIEPKLGRRLKGRPQFQSHFWSHARPAAAGGQVPADGFHNIRELSLATYR
jgi:hypothetical protein